MAEERWFYPEGIYVYKKKDDALLSFDIHVDRFINFLQNNYKDRRTKEGEIKRVMHFDVVVNEYGRITCQCDKQKFTYINGEYHELKDLVKWQRKNS